MHSFTRNDKQSVLQIIGEVYSQSTLAKIFTSADKSHSKIKLWWEREREREREKIPQLHSPDEKAVFV